MFKNRSILRKNNLRQKAPGMKIAKLNKIK